MIVEIGPMTRHQGQDLLAQLGTPGHPLEVATPAVMVGTVQTSTKRIDDPTEELLVPGMHPQRDLRVAPIAAEVTLPDQNAYQIPLGELARAPGLVLRFW